MRNRYYITTPIFYVNAAPHIGHTYTLVLADVHARAMKLINKDIKLKFLTGTDEHGQKVETAAKNANVSPKDFVDKVSQKFVELAEKFNISYDDFIRTTESRHIRSVEHLWKKLQEVGDIYLDVYAGWYSMRDEAFYSEEELIDGKAPSGSEVEWVEEPSYFFALSKWGEKLLAWYESNPESIQPASCRNEILSFIKSGLKDISISRKNVNWGIKVPGEPSQVIYVWLDALTNYISAIGYPDVECDEFQTFWPADLHLVGKDITRFHAVYWPAFLMSAKLPLPKKILAHGWWTNEGQKISKSVGNTIDPFELAEEFGTDEVRYFLLKEITIGNDGKFSRTQLINRVNSELSNKIGNLVHRTLSFVIKYNDMKVPDLSSKEIKECYESDLLKSAISLKDDFVDLIHESELNAILDRIIVLSEKANSYMDHQAPWKLRLEAPNKMNEVLYVLVEFIRYLGIFLSPFVPEAASKILDFLSISTEERYLSNLTLSDAIKPNLLLKQPVPVFCKINETEE